MAAVFFFPGRLPQGDDRGRQLRHVPGAIGFMTR